MSATAMSKDRVLARRTHDGTANREDEAMRDVSCMTMGADARGPAPSG
jgi:hypothetical protein